MTLLLKQEIVVKENVETAKNAVWKDCEILHLANGTCTGYIWCKNCEQFFKHEKNVVMLVI